MHARSCLHMRLNHQLQCALQSTNCVVQVEQGGARLQQQAGLHPMAAAQLSNVTYLAADVAREQLQLKHTQKRQVAQQGRCQHRSEARSMSASKTVGQRVRHTNHPCSGRLESSVLQHDHVNAHDMHTRICTPTLNAPAAAKIELDTLCAYSLPATATKGVPRARQSMATVCAPSGTVSMNS